MKKFLGLALVSLLALIPLAAEAQVAAQVATVDHVVAPATPAVRTPKTKPGTVVGIECTNTTAATVYIHFYDTTPVTLGTTNDSWSVGCPGNTAGAGIVHEYAWARSFFTAISWAVTGGIAANDNTSITASSVDVNIGFN